MNFYFIIKVLHRFFQIYQGTVHSYKRKSYYMHESHLNKILWNDLRKYIYKISDGKEQNV